MNDLQQLEQEKEALRDEYIAWRTRHIDPIIQSSAADEAVRTKGTDAIVDVFQHGGAADGKEFLENAISRMVQVRTDIARAQGTAPADIVYTPQRLKKADMAAAMDVLTHHTSDVVGDYLSFKAHLFNHAPQLDYTDLGRPVADWQGPSISWDDTKEMVRASFKPLGFEHIADDVLEHHTHASAGRSSNASMENGKVVININPTGSLLDPRITTHEVGHGIHYTLAGTGDIPPSVAEIVSVFSEALWLKEMRQRTKDDPRAQMALLSNQLDADLQYLAYAGKFLFESKAYAFAESHPQEKIPVIKLWHDTMASLLSDTVRLDGKNGEALDAQLMQWDHYMHVPGYGQAYMIAWAAAPQLIDKLDDPDFKEKFTNLLKRGKDITPKEFLAELGLDLTRPEFWNARMEKMREDVVTLKQRHRQEMIGAYGNRHERAQAPGAPEVGSPAQAGARESWINSVLQRLQTKSPGQIG